MSYSEDDIRTIVRRVLLRTLGLETGPAAAPSPAGRASKPLVTEADVLAVPTGGTLAIPAEAVLTPLARDTALDRRVELVREPAAGVAGVGARSAASGGGHPSGGGRRAVALGADHGGYALKENLKTYLGELGYDVVDCGTTSTESVDYPDFAYAVARLVSDGQAWRGIMVDGAGIGSCMAANKVPGVRAAMCYDHATAVNSREHNDANVLTLGGVLLGTSLARQIVKVWLETEFGGGRHARRVDKIMAIERRYQRH
jgi:ribose 5-phosphate isomerase B